MIFGDYYTLSIVIACTALLGLTTGIIGAFALLREQSLLGDAIAHACLPGTALAFLATGNAHPAILMFGSLCAGICAIIIITTIRRATDLKMDTILGGTLSVFFGFGLVCMTIVQKYPLHQQSILTSIIFGNAATLCMHDGIITAIAALVVLSCIAVLWKELQLITFDSTYATISGYAAQRYDTVLTSLLFITIAIGLPMIGVILMSTMLIAPAAAARLWTSRFGPFVICSGVFGALFSIIGTCISTQYYHMPTGPVIAVVAVTWTLLSLVITTKKNNVLPH